MVDDSLQFESTRTSTSVGGGGFVTPFIGMGEGLMGCPPMRGP